MKYIYNYRETQNNNKKNIGMKKYVSVNPKYILNKYNSLKLN